ncbi:MAG: rRNA pseudouridine synthase [Oscillospiraceae bacterium]|nr:rRNA pseudouridine synthase [Oscillospiraceae bacterium]
MEKIRIQKIIADSGYCSRRKAEELISQGLVTVNGRGCSLGDKASPMNDLIKVGDNIISAERAEKRYIMLNKPRGYVTSMADEKGRRIAAELLTDVQERVYPVGRLDRNSEGLLIFTNDGEFANDIMHPSRHVAKTYRVTIDGRVNEEQLSRLMAGVEIEEGVWTLPCTVEVLTEGAERTVLRFVIKEGRNRQIRRMCEAVGLQVGRLRRTAVGGVKLGMLKPGEYRDLTKEELRKLRTAVGKGVKQGRG